MKSGFILSMMSFFFFPMAFRRLSASPLEKPASFWDKSMTCSWYTVMP